MVVKRACVERGEHLVYVAPNVEESGGMFFVDFIVRREQRICHACKEAVFSTREEAEKKVKSLQKILKRSK